MCRYAAVTEHLHELNHIHVSTAFNRLGKLCKLQDSSPRRLTDDAEAFGRLLRLTREFAKAGTFEPRHVANTVHGIARLRAAKRVHNDTTDGSDSTLDGTLAALEAAAGRAAPGMNDQEIANTWYAFATLGRMPAAETWAALDAAAARAAPEMIPQGVCNVLHAYARLGKAPGAETWSVLDTTVGAKVSAMTSQGVATTVGLATVHHVHHVHPKP